MAFEIPDFPGSTNTALTNQQRDQLVWLLANLPAAMNAMEALANSAIATAGNAEGVAQIAAAKVDNMTVRLDDNDIVVAGGDQFANGLQVRIVALEQKTAGISA